MSSQLSKTVKTQWRAQTSGLRAMPSFIIIGTQRGGTTSLYSWLTADPDVAPATHKELHYFDGRNYDRGMRWYRSQFPILRPGQITGESTPHMLYNPVSPARAASDLPEQTRFVVLLRDPVERTLSHYWLSRRNGTEVEDLETALSLEGDRLAKEEGEFESGRYSYAHHKFSYTSRGDYATQLERWFKLVGRERLLIMESETLFADRDQLSKLTDWLKLKRRATPLPALNAADRSDVDPAIVSRLQEHFEPSNRRLFEMLGRPLWGQ